MQTKDAILGRRSVRQYNGEKISDEDLKEIIEAGLYAPSGVNLQPWYFLAIKNEEKLKELYEIMGKVVKGFRPNLEKRFPKNPEVIEETEKFLGNLGGASVCILAFLLKEEYNEKLTPVESTSAAIENMLLMAYDKGISSCWLTAILESGHDEEIRQKFAPDKGRLIAAITLGYSDVKPKAPARKAGRYDII